MDTEQSPSSEHVDSTSCSSCTATESRIETLAKKVAESAQAFGTQCAALQREFNKIDAPILQRAKSLAASTSEQARAHPLATFGVAFAAGAILARLLRR